MLTPEDWWQQFQAAFKQYFIDTAYPSINWWNPSERTQRYANEVMPYVATKLGLEPGKEEFTVDYVMSRYGQTLQTVNDAAWHNNNLKCPLLPVIFIESENDIYTADHEIRKLCALNTPLRVLLTMTADADEHWKNLKTLLNLWQAIVREHAIGNPVYGGVIGVMIGWERKGRVHYSTCALDRDARRLHPYSAFCQGFTVKLP